MKLYSREFYPRFYHWLTSYLYTCINYNYIPNKCISPRNFLALLFFFFRVSTAQQIRERKRERKRKRYQCISCFIHPFPSYSSVYQHQNFAIQHTGRAWKSSMLFPRTFKRYSLSLFVVVFHSYSLFTFPYSRTFVQILHIDRCTHKSFV